MYIEREKAIQQMADNFRQASVDGCDNQFYRVAEDTLSELPAADVEPIRRGNWSLRGESQIDNHTGEADTIYWLECSLCRRRVYDIDNSKIDNWLRTIEPFPYCHCGAKMHSKQEEEWFKEHRLCENDEQTSLWDEEEEE